MVIKYNCLSLLTPSNGLQNGRSPLLNTFECLEEKSWMSNRRKMNFIHKT